MDRGILVIAIICFSPLTQPLKPTATPLFAYSIVRSLVFFDVTQKSFFLLFWVTMTSAHEDTSKRNLGALSPKITCKHPQKSTLCSSL